MLRAATNLKFVYHAAVVFKLVAVIAGVGLATWFAFPSDTRQRRFGESFARRNQAYVAAEFVTDFNRAAVRVQRYIAAVFVFNLSGIWLLDVTADLRRLGNLAYVPVLSLSFAVLALLRLRVAGREFETPPGRRLVARARRVVPGDYIPISSRLLTAVSALWVGALGVVAFVLARSGQLPARVGAATALSAAVTVGLAVVVHVATRATCDRRQAAVDACHLYFQDAWRSESLAYAYWSVSWCAFLTTLGLFATADAPEWLESMLGPAAAALLVVTVCVIAPRKQFRKRLWPTLAPGQVLMPGEQVPAKVAA